MIDLSIISQLLASQMAGAKAGNKNVSGVMGGMDNPILLALAGAIDPYYSQNVGQQSSPLYGSFAGDESTPEAVRAVMDWVDQGMNKYQIEAKINTLPSSVKTDSGFTDQQLIGMGADMADERSSDANKNVFAKAGLRNPNDVYTMADVPVTGKNLSVMSKFLASAQAKQPVYEEAERQSSLQRKNAGSRIISSDEAKKLSKKIGNRNVWDMYSYSPTRGAELYLKDILDETKGDVDITEFLSGKTFSPDVESALKKTKKRGVMSTSKQDELSRGLVAASDAKNAVSSDLLKAQAVQRGVLRAYQETGRTPFTDQASAYLKFISGSK